MDWIEDRVSISHERKPIKQTKTDQILKWVATRVGHRECLSQTHQDSMTLWVH